MIGEEQSKGYPEDFAEESATPEPEEPVNKEHPEEDEAFKQRKKMALAMIGRTEVPEETRILTDEEIRQKVEKDRVSTDNLKQILISMQHDILILRTQMDNMVKVLNKLQIGFINKLNELKRDNQ